MEGKRLYNVKPDAELPSLLDPTTAGRFGCMRMIHRLHASSQAECRERALDTFSERDAGAS